MAKRIGIGLTNQTYKRVEELAATVDMKVTEVARMGLRRILAHPDEFLRWIDDESAHAARDGARAITESAA